MSSSDYNFLYEEQAKCIDALQKMLDEYTSTGFTPEEILKYKSMILWLAEYAPESEEKFIELLKANKEGRIWIMPVSDDWEEGTAHPKQHIFCDGACFAPHCAGQVHELTDWSYEYPMIHQYFGSEEDYSLDPEEYNKSWFTDRDACVKYLQKKYPGKEIK